MLDNSKTADLVRRELENDLYIMGVLRDKLVNYTALARSLLPVIKKNNQKATLESVSIAIKRYVLKEKTVNLKLIIKKIIARSQLSTKNDVFHATFKRTDQVIKNITDISKKIEWEKDEILFINQVFGEITIIIDEKNKNLLHNCRKYLIKENSDLSVLSIKENFQKNLDYSVNVPGVYSYFINALSRRSINIIEIISTFSQLTFVLSNENLMKAHEIIDSRIRFFREREN